MTPTAEYPTLAKAINVPALYFKREDQHPYGSHKGRSIPVMIQTYHQKGDRHFAISSSGNAALAAALHIIEYNKKAPAADKMSLTVFVGLHISPHKLARLKGLESDHISILSKERPLQALTQAVHDGVRSLRQSQDDLALAGYNSLGQELAEIPGLAAVFVGTSSGTTAQALATYFIEHHLPVQVHIVQTSACHPLSDAFETFDGHEEESIADAIVDRTATRKAALIPLIQKTGGYGWFATNDQITTAQTLTTEHTNLSISTNSALSVAGAMQAPYRGWPLSGAVVCLICGE